MKAIGALSSSGDFFEVGDVGSKMGPKLLALAVHIRNLAVNHM